MSSVIVVIAMLTVTHARTAIKVTCTVRDYTESVA